MKRILFWLSALCLFVPTSASRAEAKLNVVATIPDLADLTREVGGDLVDVRSLATGVESIHAVPMKPSFAIALNRADAVVLLGLEAEHAFLPGLLDGARNPNILRGAPGYIDCSVYVTALDIPTRIDRSLGEQHPMGNPHYNTDPVRWKEAARALADGLTRLDAGNRETYEKNLDSYLTKLDTAITRWNEEAKPLRGKKLVSYHPDMTYLADRFGLQTVGTIEIRAGVDPTPAHIADLEEQMRKQEVDFVVRELNYPAQLAASVAERTGATLVEIPMMVGGVPEAKDYISFIDYVLRTMLSAAKGD